MTEQFEGPWTYLDGEEDNPRFDTQEEATDAARKRAEELDDQVAIEVWNEGQWWCVGAVGTPVTYDDWQAPQEIVLGDYVISEHHGHKGRVYKVHPGSPAGLGCPEDDAWLAGQEIPVGQYKKDRWISVLVHGGGSVTVPAKLAERVDPFPFENRYANQYFREES